MNSVFNEQFWQAIDRLVKENPVAIDRPAGTEHPRYPGLIYPLDYGYLEGTCAVDGGGIDVWVGSQRASIVTGVILTVDLHKNDAELKILHRMYSGRNGGYRGSPQRAIPVRHTRFSQPVDSRKILHCALEE